MSQLEEYGEIVSIENHKAVVKIEKRDGCENCGAKEHCLLFQDKDWLVETTTPMDLRPGEKVKLAIAGKNYLKSAALIFILPLIALIFFYLIASFMVSDGWAILIGFMGFITGIAIAWIINRGKGTKNFSYRIIERLVRNDE